MVLTRNDLHEPHSIGGQWQSYVPHLRRGRREHVHRASGSVRNKPTLSRVFSEIV